MEVVPGGCSGDDPGNGRRRSPLAALTRNYDLPAVKGAAKCMTQVFFLHDAWCLLLDGKMVPAEFNSKGAAEAAIEVERSRRAKKVGR